MKRRKFVQAKNRLGEKPRQRLKRAQELQAIGTFIAEHGITFCQPFQEPDQIELDEPNSVYAERNARVRRSALATAGTGQ